MTRVSAALAIQFARFVPTSQILPSGVHGLPHGRPEIWWQLGRADSLDWAQIDRRWLGEIM